MLRWEPCLEASSEAPRAAIKGPRICVYYEATSCYGPALDDDASRNYGQHARIPLGERGR
jgi:hypothetical protein